MHKYNIIMKCRNLLFIRCLISKLFELIKSLKCLKLGIYWVIQCVAKEKKVNQRHKFSIAELYEINLKLL